MRNRHNFVKDRDPKNVFSVLSSDYYNENCQLNADFSTIAYVFVFLIIPKTIRICLFPSITPTSNAKKYTETHRHSSQCQHIGTLLSVCRYRLK